MAAASGSFDDQLLAGPVDVRGALQQVGAGDAEPVQDVLDRAGTHTRVACEVWSGCGWARAGIAAGAGGPGGGQQVAGGPDGGGRLAGLRGCFGGGFGGVLALAEQGVDVAGECGGCDPRSLVVSEHVDEVWLMPGT